MTEIPPNLPKTVTTAELRWLLGDLTAGRISQLETEGIIKRAGPSQFELASVPAYVMAMRDRSEGPKSYREARVSLLREKAAVAKLDRLEREGRLVELEAVEGFEVGVAAAWRQRIWAWPTRIAPRLALCKTPAAAEALLREELREHMFNFSETGAAAVLGAATKHLEKRRRTKKASSRPQRDEDQDGSETIKAD